jgi:hypothetical protein
MRHVVGEPVSATTKPDKRLAASTVPGRTAVPAFARKQQMIEISAQAFGRRGRRILPTKSMGRARTLGAE